MKLFHSSTSPFVRKVRIVANILGLKEGNNLQLISVLPFERPSELTQYNPLSKIPTLVTDGGEVIIDSKLIVTYLLNRFPSTRIAEQKTDKQSIEEQSLANIAEGIIENSISLVIENRKPEDKQIDAFNKNISDDITRSMAHIEKNLPSEELNVYAITLMCAIDFLEFRLPQITWRESCSKLSKWHSIMNESYPIFKNTYPV